MTILVRLHIILYMCNISITSLLRGHENVHILNAIRDIVINVDKSNVTKNGWQIDLNINVFNDAETDNNNPSEQ